MNELFRMKALLKLTGGSSFDGECLVWSLGKTEAGYGQVCIDSKIYYAHRLSHEIFIGALGKLSALHKCDNPACWKPGHLFSGTQQDNIADMKAKGRHAHGASVVTAKISERQARKIAADCRSQTVIAAEHGLSQSQVSRIKSKKRWSHL